MRAERTGFSAGIVLLEVSVDIVVDGVVEDGGVEDDDVGGLIVVPGRESPWLPDELVELAPWSLLDEDVVCAYEKPIALTTASVAIAEARDLRDFI